MIQISYKTLWQAVLFCAGIALAAIINGFFGLETTVIIMGGACAVLAARTFMQK